MSRRQLPTASRARPGSSPELLADEHVERVLRVLEDPVGDPGRLVRVKPLARYEAASSASSSSGIASISARSSAIWRSNSSRWLCIEMYSPAAMLKAPASRPAIPARRMKLGWPAAAPATPMTSDRLLTRPSLTPKMTARRVPDRPPARCQCSRCPISAALRARRAIATPSRPESLRPGTSAPLLSRSQISACSRSSAAIAATSGEPPWASYSVLLVALERLDQLGDRGRSRRAGRPG